MGIINTSGTEAPTFFTEVLTVVPAENRHSKTAADFLQMFYFKLTPCSDCCVLSSW
jgi:hypothetical protein